MKKIIPLPPINWPESRNLFWSFLCVVTFCACLAGEGLIRSSAQEQGRQITQAMRDKAESLVWALEAGARFFRRKRSGPVNELLAEMARQPGVSWIAVTNSRGSILFDSDAGLEGEQLYTPEELAQLKPANSIQGRFGPDDPALYECWKLFRPERLGRQGKKLERNDPYFIFVALNAYTFLRGMEERLKKTRLVAALVCAAIPVFLALLFYIYNFRLSRRKLQAVEALAMEIISNYPGGLLLTDLHGNTILSNREAEKFLNLGEGVEPTDLNLRDCIDKLANGSILEKEINLPGPDLSPRPVSLSAALIPGEGGKRALFVLRDLTEIRLLYKKLSQSRRLSAIGRMAAAIAHEIRNPLSSIRGYARYLCGRLENDPLGKSAAELLSDETRRINETLTEMLAFARPPQLNLKPNSLLQTVRKAALIIRPDADSKKISLKTDFPPDARREWPLTDNDKLLQAILNLLINAIQFAPTGGEVSLSLKRAEKSGLNPSGWLIQVKDNGPGIAATALSQIFNPYYTTREGGSGLGLATARRIVESHGGEITVSSAPRKGALFTIFLPDHLLAGETIKNSGKEEEPVF